MSTLTEADFNLYDYKYLMNFAHGGKEYVVFCVIDDDGIPMQIVLSSAVLKSGKYVSDLQDSVAHDLSSADITISPAQLWNLKVSTKFNEFIKSKGGEPVTFLGALVEFFSKNLVYKNGALVVV